MIYSVVAIAKLLQLDIDFDQTVCFIVSSQNQDGGFGLSQFSESHGGATYCAVNTLFMTDSLSKIDRSNLIRWLVNRQIEVEGHCGFQGRINKFPDSCYSFWIGSSL